MAKMLKALTEDRQQEKDLEVERKRRNEELAEQCRIREEIETCEAALREEHRK